MNSTEANRSQASDQPREGGTDARKPGGSTPDARPDRDSPYSDDPGPGAGKTSGDPADYIPPGGEDVEGGDPDNLDGLQRPRGGTPNVPRP